MKKQEKSLLCLARNKTILPTLVATAILSAYGCSGSSDGSTAPTDPTCSDNQTLVDGECVDNEPTEPTTYSQSDLVSYLLSDSTSVELATDSQGIAVDSFSYQTTEDATLRGYALIPKTSEDDIVASLDDSGNQVLSPYTAHILLVDEATYSGLDLTLADINQVQTQNADGINTFITASGVVAVYPLPSEEMSEEKFTQEKETLESIFSNNIALDAGLNLFAYGNSGYRRPGGTVAEMPGTIEQASISGGYGLGAEIDTTQILVYYQNGGDAEERILLGDHYNMDGNNIKLHEWTEDNLDDLFKFENLNNGIYNLFMNGTNDSGENVLVYVGTLDKDSNCSDGNYQVDPNDEGPTYSCQ